MDIALLITLAFFALAIAFTLVLLRHDLKMDRDFLDRLQKETQAVRTPRGGKGLYQKRPYQYVLCQGGEHGGTLFQLQLEAAVACDLLITQHSSSKLAAEKMGLVETICSGDLLFDQNYFVTSPNTTFAQQIINNEQQRLIIRHLFQAGVSRLFYSVEQQVILIEISPFTQWESWSGNDVFRLLEKLQQLPLPQATQPRKKNRFNDALSLFVSLYMMLLFMLCISFFAGMYADTTYQPLDRWAMFKTSMLISLPCFILFGWYSYFLLKRMLEAYKHWIGLMSIALFVFPIFSYTSISFINGAWDNSPPQQLSLTVVSKHKQHQNGTIHYQLHTAAHEALPAKTWQVNQAVFKKIKPKKAGKNILQLQYSNGAFGYAWHDPNQTFDAITNTD